jgi:hypothetical protein
VKNGPEKANEDWIATATNLTELQIFREMPPEAGYISLA